MYVLGCKVKFSFLLWLQSEKFEEHWLKKSNSDKEFATKTYSPLVLLPHTHPIPLSNYFVNFIIWHELQNNLRMAATCAGLGVSRQGQPVNRVGWF